MMYKVYMMHVQQQQLCIEHSIYCALHIHATSTTATLCMHPHHVCTHKHPPHTQQPTLLFPIAPLTIVPVCFACFVYHNGGVVVGDRSAHAPTAHCMQPLYCVGWITLALLPVVLTQRRYVCVCGGGGGGGGGGGDEGHGVWMWRWLSQCTRYTYAHSRTCLSMHTLYVYALYTCFTCLLC